MANTLLGDTEEALDAMDEFVDIAGNNNVFAYYWRGVANLNAGNYDDAIDDFEESLESDNNHFYDYLWLSLAYQLNGDEDDAADALEDAMSELEDESDDFLRLRKEAVLALVTGDEDAAIEALEEILEIAPLAHQRRSDHFYLVSLTLIFPDEALFADTLEWFRAEIGVD
jgi:tetratricopeptide (TPR) repeat protein